MANVSKHRYRVAGLAAVEEEKWGRATARSRYGEPQHEDGAPPPPDREAPQRAGDDNNLRGTGWQNDAAGWVRGCDRGTPQMKDETAENKPGFDKRGKDGLPLKW